MVEMDLTGTGQNVQMQSELISPDPQQIILGRQGKNSKWR